MAGFLSQRNNHLESGGEEDRQMNLLHNDHLSSEHQASQRRENSISYRLMKFIGNVLAIVATIGFIIAVPLISYHAVQDQTRPDFVAFYSAGMFVLVTIAMSTKLIYNHLTNWYMPDVQKYVVRILWMVPIYAIQSLLSLRFHKARIYIDTVRDLYEAYVIQSFLYYLMELLGGEDTLAHTLQEMDPYYGNHQAFLKYFIPRWNMGCEFMMNCKYGVLQYVIAKVFSSLVIATFEPMGLYNEGEISITSASVYVNFIINVSQMWAIYCLVKFYHATHENLSQWHPLGKFLCIKGVVFFTWWQGVGLAVLKSNGLIPEIGTWDKNDVANGLQDYLICVEMFCFAIAHAYTFTHKEYLPNSPGSSGYARLHPTNEEASSDESDFQPPVIRTLNTPMTFRDALWSSTVPNETIHDIRRLRTGALEPTSPGILRNVSVQHAESV
jgi:hypothetical protein